MILDATAGNRSMWQHKNTESIIYIDIEKRLAVKPTIFCDNTNTPFLDNTFDTIFYDPPHYYRTDDSDLLTMTRAEIKLDMKFKHRLHTYYGSRFARYKHQIIRNTYLAQKEFMRILAPDGLLWIKWCETKLTLKRILSIFAEWQILMIINVADPTHTMGKYQTYWVCLCKKNIGGEQTRFEGPNFH